MAERVFQTGQGRLFLQEYGAGPGHHYRYLGCAQLTGFSKAEGDITPVRCQSAKAYDQFEVVDEVAGEEGLPTTSLVMRLGYVNPIMYLKCPFDIQVHWGKCQDPTDFNGGWDKILAFRRARITTRSSDDLMAMDSAGRAPITLTGAITAREMAEVDRMVLGERAESVTSREVVGVAICDSVSCGECGWESEGCRKIYAIIKTSGLASPGILSELIYSEDGGATWHEQTITTLASDEDPTGIACVGNNIVVISADSASLHYAPKDDLTDWHEVTTGFADGPLAIFSLSATQTWIVGDDGYVYYTEDPTAGVEVQDDGTASGGNALNDVMAMDSKNIVVVGDLNTVIVSANGGLTWASITGP